MIVRGSAIAVRLAATSIFNATIITWIFGVLMNLQQMRKSTFHDNVSALLVFAATT
jgi:hypothetical protein